ncbi:MAG: flippase-like domain-containing protein [Flavobacteriales bacterium]|nr:flippase-like domain-containing protein [Flavobacteriales bacterium]
MTKKSLRYLSISLKIGIIICTLSAVVYKVTNNKDFGDIQTYYKSVINQENQLLLLGLVMLLLPLNWIIESIKWRFLVKKVQNISFAVSLKSVLAGVTLGAITPNRIGEYAGRVLFVAHRSRIYVALCTILSGVAQITATILFGTSAFYFYYLFFIKSIEESWFESYLLILILLFNILILIVFLNSSALLLLIKKLKLSTKASNYLSIFKRYHTRELIIVLGWSTLRYFVFSIQLILLLYFFQVDIPLNLLAILIPISFLVLAVIPSIALAELGIREAVALTFLGQVSDNHLGIISATFLLWLINLAIPAGIGSFLILKAKIFNQET